MTAKNTKIEANIGINEAHKQQITDGLNGLLANEHVLYMKSRKFHWNIEGALFGPLHELFEEQYDEQAEFIDEIAERIRRLGHFAVGSFKQYLKMTDLVEHVEEVSIDHKQALTELCQDHETIIRIIREKLIPKAEEYKDYGTSDMLNSIMQKHEAAAWKLRATVK